MTTKPEWYYGNTHIFTSKSSNKEVELVASNDEQFRIDNIKNVSTYTSDRLATLNINEISDPQTNQHTNLDLSQQGTSVSMAVNGTRTYLAVGGPNYAVGASTGGVALFNSDNLENFIQESTVLVSMAYTDTGSIGFFSHINEDATLCCLSNATAVVTNTSIYRRTGAVWNYLDFVPGYVNVLSGNYLLISSHNGLIAVYYIAPGIGPVLQQTIYNTGVLGYNIAITGGNTIVFERGLGLFEHWSRTGTVWTYRQTFTLGVNSSVRLFNNTLLFYNATNVLIYNKTSTDYVYNSKITTPNIACACMNNKFIFVGTTTHIKIYSYTVLGWTELGTSLGSTGCFNMAATDNILAVGKPTNSAGRGETITYAIRDIIGGFAVKNEIRLVGKTSSERITVKSLLGGLDIYCNTIFKKTAEITGSFSVLGASLLVGLVSITNNLAVAGAITGSTSIMVGESSGLSQGMYNRGNTAQSLAASTYANVVGTWATGPSTQYGTVSNMTMNRGTGVLTINRAGNYIIHYRLSYQAYGAGGYRTVKLVIGGVFSDMISSGHTGGNVTGLSGTTIAYCPAATTIYLNAHHEAGIALGCINAELNVFRIGD